MRVLVTGGAGFIGSHACKALARAGHEPIAFDSLRTGHRHAVKWGPLEQGDIRDGAALDRAFATYRPDAVMHFAALAYVGESVEQPEIYYDTNVGGTLSLLEAMQRAGASRIVFSSSCAVYGAPETVPIPEAAPCKPMNPYGRSKLMAEQIIADCCDAYSMAGIALRYFNAAGADPEGELGEEHDPETHLIPIVLQTALGQRDSVSILGTGYPTPDGTCIRDYIHVTDLADAHVSALEALREKTLSAFNLGTGRGYSVCEVIDAAREVSGRQIRSVNAEPRPGDPPVLVAGAGRAAAELAWTPRHSDLKPMIGHAWEWLARQHDRAGRA
jgi:UDP-arabinose 4-epimerase